MKTVYTIVFVLLTSIVYGQKSTLLQNVNIRAKELKHGLNKTGDSLILEAERTIYKVQIFNKNFSKALLVKDSKVTIPLYDLPLGRFVVEAVMPDKLIVITLLRNKPLIPAINRPKKKRKLFLFAESTTQYIESSKPITKEIPVMHIAETTKADAIIKEKMDEIVPVKKRARVFRKVVASKKIAKVRIPEKKQSIFKERLAVTKNNSENSGKRIIEAYWIVYESNSGHGGGKIMRFGDEAMVDKMIAHITLDKRTKAGKYNKLTVWEVYDLSKFLKFKMKNKNQLTSSADCFNVVPFYQVKSNEGTTRP